MSELKQQAYYKLKYFFFTMQTTIMFDQHENTIIGDHFYND